MHGRTLNQVLIGLLWWIVGFSDLKQKGEQVMAEQIKWETDFAAALSRAKAEGKLVFLDFFNPQ